MVGDDSLRKAVDIAWSVFRATQDGIDAADSRRYLLERHLSGRPEARGGDVEELAAFGLVYLAQLPEDEC